MTAAYKESFEEPDATPHRRAGSSAAYGLTNLIKDDPARKKKAPTRPFRVLTANVRSDPDDALSLDDVLEDLKRNAAHGDLVFLQGIAPRYRSLMKEAFPRSEWEVFSGDDANREPIAFRKSLFSMVTGQVTLLNPARADLHGRRLMTHLRLRFEPLSAEFHATNVRLVDGAFGTELPCMEGRRAAWATGIDKHRSLVEELVATGLPVVGGGAYTRPLKHHKPLGTERAGMDVGYAVAKKSVDLLWCIDGRRAAWHLRSTDVFPGRSEAHAERNSDHAAHQAVIVLRPVKTKTKTKAKKKRHEREPESREPRSHEPAVDRRYLEHGPFELTRFGDTTKEVVDWKTRAALEEAERRLGYTLTITQGSYNNGRVKASGPTHDGGGVVDLRALDWKNKLHVLRSIGFAAWHRTPDQGNWPEHIHAVLIDHGRLDPSAARQVESYRRGRNGLTNDAADTFWRPDPIPVFHYPPRAANPGSDRGPAGSGTRAPGPAHGTQHHEPATPSAVGWPYPPQRTLDGVDVSHYQRTIDVPKGQAAGVRFMYAKTSEGNGWKDNTYRSKARQARKAGIPFGSYHFARPELGDAAAEAMHFLKSADIRAGDMVPMLDLESSGNLDHADLTQWVGRWVATVERELASRGLVCKPIIYTRFPLGSTFDCPLWVARYSNDRRPPVIPSPWKRAAIWQHSDGKFGPVKSVPGFGPVDVNALHPDIPLSWLRIKSAAATTRPSTATSTTGPRRPRLRTVNTPSRAGRKARSARKNRHHERSTS